MNNDLMTYKRCIFLCCFSTTLSINATEYVKHDIVTLKHKINNAIIQFEETPHELWSYQVSRYENEEGTISSSIEQYLPNRVNQWVLKEINGKKPTTIQVKKFIDKLKGTTEKKANQHSLKIKLRALIHQGSLQLKSTTDTRIVMTFDVQLEKLGEDAVGKLKGQLTYHQEQAFIEKIYIWNQAEFSPMLTANITDLAITFSFLKLNGSVLPQANEMKMKGSFAYFTEINEISVDRFSDYQYHATSK